MPSRPRLNVLFVCSRNRWRSPTAEQVWRRHPAISVRSAGTSAQARHRVTEQDIGWADVIVVMEATHKTRLVGDFGDLVRTKPVHVLGIPDDYRYMDPELVAELERSVGAILRLD
jgi:predicted protein tyrosine phosphatase